MARSFSAALDEMFKLEGVGALELSLEKKKDEVDSKKYQLDNLESQLRETEQRLKEMEAKHRRRSQMLGTSRRSPIQDVFSEGPETDESGDSDAQGRSSPSDGGGRQ
ncbi:uncharacterized protein HMPREF1541_02644 [Cyphellophora europaea CBS 101466]|uniref:Uncharacterized protein n=1 Tax=Cyphellophora europaea (strain CBS 101466) TaxID=1220924 RepID=W2S4H2_CYPE1|nr:uncharacterized protein HMPREF1541_02644 [Cyphellophora europaea CBS 101466]ETN43485.1 hypothetical protein HMPREF1541_02644 [Cyphellophora europaea CBS 101466]